MRVKQLSISTSHVMPKGGCELVYPGKKSELEIIAGGEAAIIAPTLPSSLSSWHNLLFSGDNNTVLRSLLNHPDIAGKVDLVYIDPPFGTGQDFTGHNDENFYSDKLVDNEFLEFIRERLVLLRELMSDQGSIYLHIDQKIGHYVKLLMDEVFGETNFRNDISRIKCNPKNFSRKAYGNIKDVIYLY